MALAINRSATKPPPQQTALVLKLDITTRNKINFLLTLRSRCTTLQLWQYSMADKICQNFLRASVSDNLPFFTM